MNSVIKMHVVMGKVGMHQGLVFYKLLLLLKVFKVFSSRKFLE
jgi:hypothetical protein